MGDIDKEDAELNFDKKDDFQKVEDIRPKLKILPQTDNIVHNEENLLRAPELDQ